MSKFKAGDVVRIINDNGTAWSEDKVGNIYTINRIGAKDIELQGGLHTWYYLDTLDGGTIWDRQIELVDNIVKTKFKVGDKVVSTWFLTKGEIGEIVGKNPTNNGFLVKGFSDGTKFGDYYCYGENNLRLVEEGIDELINNEPINSSINKVKNTMNTITKFVKNSLLSKEEKLLRKHGFKNDCGEYTVEAREFAVLKLCAEVEADMVKVSEGLEEEAKADK